MLPGLPEPPTEDPAKGDALLVDVGGDVDLGPPAWVPDRDEGGFAAQGLEQGRQGGGCTRAFESDVEATTAAGELAASFDDLVTGR